MFFEVLLKVILNLVPFFCGQFVNHVVCFRIFLGFWKTNPSFTSKALHVLRCWPSKKRQLLPAAEHSELQDVGRPSFWKLEEFLEKKQICRDFLEVK